MKGIKNTIILLATGLIIFNCSTAQQVSTSSLLDELIDLNRLTILEDPTYQTLHFSSFDRESNNLSRDEIGWYANSDGFGKETQPNFEKIIKAPGKDDIGTYLVCDIKGPGAVIRTWSASIKGELSVFLDEMETPVYRGPAEYFLKNPYDAMQHISIEDAKFNLTQEDAGYYPIPFSKSCRIEWKGNKFATHFYYVQVRKYSEETDVSTFRITDILNNLEKIKKINNVLSIPDILNDTDKNNITVINKSNIKAKSSKTIFKQTGQGKLTQLNLKIKAKDLTKALRQNILRISFDNHVWGQVQAPIGDFFVTAPGINPFTSLPFTVTKDSFLICRFIMPYKESVEITVDNYSDQDISISGNISSQPYLWQEDKSMYFHASWRINHGLTAYNLESQQSPFDLVFLNTHGTGRYVGTAIFLKNPTLAPSNWGSWWGEGDEKFFIDNYKFPAVFGTGTEDYFGYSWSASKHFDHAFIGQTRNDGPGNRGFIINYRFHIIDDFTYNKFLSFFMELYHHDLVPDFTYGRISYYYSLPDSFDDSQMISMSDVKIPQMPKTWSPKSFKGTKDFVFYEAEDLLDDTDNTQMASDYLWAGGNLLIWTPEKKGDKLKFTIPSNPEIKDLTISITFKKSPTSGNISIKLNGKKPKLSSRDIEITKSGIVNLKTDFHTNSRNLTFSPIEKNKLNKLVLTFEGEKGETIGIDFIWVKTK